MNNPTELEIAIIEHAFAAEELAKHIDNAKNYLQWILDEPFLDDKHEQAKLLLNEIAVTDSRELDNVMRQIETI